MKWREQTEKNLFMESNLNTIIQKLCNEVKRLGGVDSEAIKPALSKRRSPKEAPLSDIDDPNLLDLLSKILVYDPSARPSAEEIMRHRFFDGSRA